MTATEAPLPVRPRRWLKLLLWGALVAVLVVAATVGVGFWLLVGRYRLPRTDVSAGTYRINLESGGRQRYYLLHVPAQASGGAPFPLVVALHGGGGKPETMDGLTHLLEIADQRGFLVALPAGIGGGWNDGRLDSGVEAARDDIDDVAFIRAVVDDIGATVAVDGGRVYATGISNGAMMAMRLACEAADRFAAVAPVAGTAPEGFEASCHPVRPVAVITFLSTADPLVPFEGGNVGTLLGLRHRSRGRVTSARSLEAFWSTHNGCASEPVRADLPDLDRHDGSTVSRAAYNGCAASGAVVVYTLDGAGHTWPGGRQYLARWLIGKTNRDIDASTLIGEFFAAQPAR